MSRRWPAVVLIVAALVAGAVLDEGGTTDETRTVAPAGSGDGEVADPIALGPVDPGEAMPVVAGAEALSSVWYCAGGTGYATGTEPVEATEDGDEDEDADEGTDADEEEEDTDEEAGGDAGDETGGDEEAGGAEGTKPGPVGPVAAHHTVVVANPTDEVVETTVTVHGGGTDEVIEPVSAPLTVEPYSRKSARLGDLVEAPYVSALIEAPGGGVAVEHVVSGPHGFDAAPCSSSASDRWFFATGATTGDARMVLAVFNPFPDTANVDVTYTATDGVRTPGPSQGVIVPGRSVVAIDVDAQVTVRDQVSAVVDARSGRVVVDRLQSFDGTGAGDADTGPEGLTGGLGAPRAAAVWYIARGKKVEGNTESIVISNPTEREASVELELVVEEGDEAVEPFEVSVRPGRFTVVDLTAEERVPDDLAFATVVRSLNGVPVVAERIDVRGDPSSRDGVAITLGSPLVAAEWVVPAGEASADVDEWLTFLNVSDEPVTVSVVALDEGERVPLPEVDDITVAPRRRWARELGGSSDDTDEDVSGEDVSGEGEADEDAGRAVVVEASGPIVVERGLYRVDEVGVSQHQAIPLLPPAEAPAPPG